MPADIIKRSAELHAAAVSCMSRSEPTDHPRVISAYQCALMSVEHAAGAVALLTIGMPNAAMALFRPQFETLIRGVWLLEAADEKWVRQYHEPLSEESARAADKAPGVKRMFDELLKLEDPRVKGIVAHLDEYRAQSLRALNSFTHGGMHPMARSGTGYPVALVDNVVRCANGLVCYAAQMAALVSTDAQANMARVRTLHQDFLDCLPGMKDAA
ncbi:hypothetical protein CupriaWKF_26695 [Cupriavidus sp. WKF15]|uniref:DUF6988 family protein n=1 Tax=Cupriavidus sp. WKF15 TaxID=3032282 RepID=UPI0023E2F96B|nr:hypothetical protein [Cupriavidus sp. WKF15]WER48377.1 hypothetical protein CupriaWKF_26695 [Cupriavidus sp. WKF15]